MTFSDRNNAKTTAPEMSADMRLQTAATAMKKNQELHETDLNGNRGHDKSVMKAKVMLFIADWPTLSKEVASKMMEHYGNPNEATDSRLVWSYNSSWKKTIVYREGYIHDFPEPHVDMLEQVIDYHVPADKMSELANMEGSIVVDRTKGEVSVHCDNEAANTLSMNMMHEIVTGKRTAQDARDFIVSELTAYLKNEPAPYCETFQFTLPNTEQPFYDAPGINDPELLQAIEVKKKELE